MRLHVGIVGMAPTVADYEGDSQGLVESYEANDDRGQFLVLELTEQDINNIARMDPSATLYIAMPDSWNAAELRVMDRLTDQIKQRAGAYKRGQN